MIINFTRSATDMIYKYGEIQKHHKEM